MAAELLRSDLVDPIRFKSLMAGYGGQFLPQKSNSLRHVYFSRRLNRWFGVSSEGGAVRVNHYTDCPCTLSK